MAPEGSDRLVRMVLTASLLSTVTLRKAGSSTQGTCLRTRPSRDTESEGPKRKSPYLRARTRPSFAQREELLEDQVSLAHAVPAAEVTGNVKRRHPQRSRIVTRPREGYQPAQCVLQGERCLPPGHLALGKGRVP